MLDDIPPHRWDAILREISRIVLDFAALPTLLRPPETTIPLVFVVDGVLYRWVAAWHYNQNELSIDIDGFGRDPSTIL
jgi:hypothetical protein